MDNNNIPNEKKEQASHDVGRGRKFPLVLPEEDTPLRTRPSVTENDLNKFENNETRPSVDPEVIYREEERRIYQGRITGRQHSITSTAAPIRTRVPEEKEASEQTPPSAPVPPKKVQNSPVKKAASGVTVPGMKKPFAMRKQTKDPMPKQKPVQASVPKAAKAVGKPGVTSAANPKDVPTQKTDSKPKMNGKTVRALIIAALCLLLVGGLWGAAYFVGNSGRPVEPVETGKTETDAVETQGMETDPAETDPVETEPAVYTVTVQVYGKEPVAVTTEAITVGDLLVSMDLSSENYRPSVSLDTVITADTVLDVDYVEYKSEQISETLHFTTERREVQTIPRGETQVVQQGEDGVVTLSYEIAYINGVEASRTVIGETVTKEAVPEITEVGVGGELVGADGKTYTYSYMRVVPATYYYIEGPTWYGHDASESTVAADFDYLPLGTKLYVKNDQFDFGVRTVEDTGTMSGYEINIWLSDANPQKADFAKVGYTYDMVIYYLD